MTHATLILDRDFVLAETDRRLFGAFIEHLGRCIYTGLYEPGHPSADAHGFRQDVLSLVRELGPTVMRYPGGNFVSGYRWEDGVGPREQRPRRLELAWGALESNQFGTNEFVTWCRLAGIAPMMAVNLGLRGAAEAQQLVEYCNHPGGTELSERRRAHGYTEPHAIKLWCLGNELDGPWQIGRKTATEYGRVAAETAKVMKWTDPSLELILCGSSGQGMATFGAWALEALEHAYDYVDYLSIHTYLGDYKRDLSNFLLAPEGMGNFIELSAALCDAAGAKRKSKRRLQLSFDEWNVWYHQRGPDPKQPGWQEAPRQLEDCYTMADALVVGGMLIQLLNHADRVRLACLAQLVNVIAPIMTEPGGAAWRQTIFYPIAAVFHHGHGRVLRGLLEAPKAPGDDANARLLTVAAVLSLDGRELQVFAVNRDQHAPLPLRLDLRAFGSAQPSLTAWQVLTHSDLHATNSAEHPRRVCPLAQTSHSPLHPTLPAASWNHLRYTLA